MFTDTYMKQTAGDDGSLNYAPTPGQAAMIHFGGEIVTIRPSLSPSTLNTKGRDPVPDANGEAQVLFQVGTPGVGSGNKEYGAGSFVSFVHPYPRYRERPSRELVQVDPIAEYEFYSTEPDRRSEEGESGVDRGWL